MILGALLTIISFIQGFIQMIHGNDIGALIWLGTSIIFYVLYIINCKVTGNITNLSDYLKRGEKVNELSE